jgi:hypothetical protein
MHIPVFMVRDYAVDDDLASVSHTPGDSSHIGNTLTKITSINIDRGKPLYCNGVFMHPSIKPFYNNKANMRSSL